MDPVSVDMVDFIDCNLPEIGKKGEVLFIGSDIPARQNIVISITDTGTEGQDSPNISYTRSRFNILVRSRDGWYLRGLKKAEVIKNFLHGVTSVRINSSWYIQIFQTSGPAFVGMDDSNYNLFSTNFTSLRTAVE